MKTVYVYIITNQSKTLYIGVTSNLERRIYQHAHRLIPGFSSRYNIGKLIYYEQLDDAWLAMAREKVLKGWRSHRKIDLINSVNPAWDDLSAAWV